MKETNAYVQLSLHIVVSLLTDLLFYATFSNNEIKGTIAL